MHPDSMQAAQALGHIQERLDLLAEFGRDALQHAELVALLHRACEDVAKAMQVERSKVLRYRPESADLLIVAGVGWEEGVVGQAILKTDVASPPGRALQTATSVSIEDLTVTEEYRYSDLLREHGIKSLINVPIVVDGINWGVLEVDSIDRRQFTAQDEKFMTIFAQLVGAAVLRDKAAQAEQQHAEQSAALEKRRDLMIRELHHRVRNNFQIIVSMLLQQSRKLADEPARLALREIADRTIAIALAHDQLSLTQTMQQVSMDSYLAALIGRIVPERPEITIDLALRPMEVGVDQAVLVGLIVNEAITNAIKHAFQDSAPGTIRVECAPIPGRSGACVSVSDNGSGMLEPREGRTGLSLLEALCQQLSGELTIDSRQGGGTTITVRFPFGR